MAKCYYKSIKSNSHKQIGNGNEVESDREKWGERLVSGNEDRCKTDLETVDTDTMQCI